MMSGASTEDTRSNRHNRTTRILAAFLAVGGIAGIGTAAFLLFRFAEQGWPLALLFLFMGAFFAWAAGAGIALWRDTEYGWRWAPVVFATQVPVIVTPALQYSWYTGLMFAPVWYSGDGVSSLNFTMNFGANATLHIAAGGAVTGVGLNLFALVATILLVRAKRRLNAGGDRREAAGAGTDSRPAE